MQLSMGRAGAVVRLAVAWWVALSAALACTASGAATYEVVHEFRGVGGGFSPFGLTTDAQGTVYGTAGSGGAAGGGTLYKLTAEGFKVLHAFGAAPDGSVPVGPPMLAPDGLLYGTTALGGLNGNGVVYRMDTSGGNYQALSMQRQAESHAGLITDGVGNFFGVTFSDIRHGTPLWPGTVFRASFETGEVQTIHLFHGWDGEGPEGRLAWFDGKLIGTTYEGGMENRGTAFSINPDGTGFAVERLQNGARRNAGLTVDRKGRIWGIAGVDWVRPARAQGYGGIYQVDLQGNARVAYRFTAEVGGGNTRSALTLASDGLLYNSGYMDGDPRCGCGSIYRFDPETETVEVLHTFTELSQGAYPRGGLVEAAPGVFYGTAEGGPGDRGVVFRFTP